MLAPWGFLRTFQRVDTETMNDFIARIRVTGLLQGLHLGQSRKSSKLTRSNHGGIS